MELVFIHGWGFDADFWEPLGALLPGHKKIFIDLGYFGGEKTPLPKTQEKILIGHSLGFFHGIESRQGWHGWVAINAFPRFVGSSIKPGCVPPANLRAMRTGLKTDMQGTLNRFYQLIGATPPPGLAVSERLAEGLDALRHDDIRDALGASPCPGLILASRNDPLVPEQMSQELATNAPSGALHMHETAGHLLPLADPQWCAQAIKNFLTEKLFNA